MSASEEDEFGTSGWADDQELLLAAGKAERLVSKSRRADGMPPATKRRRLNGAGVEMRDTPPNNKRTEPSDAIDAADVFVPRRAPSRGNAAPRTSVEAKIKHCQAAGAGRFSSSPASVAPAHATTVGRRAPPWTASKVPDKSGSQTTSGKNMRAKDKNPPRPDRWPGGQYRTPLSERAALGPKRGVSGGGGTRDASRCETIETLTAVGVGRRPLEASTPYKALQRPPLQVVTSAKSANVARTPHRDSTGEGRARKCLDEADVLDELEGLPSDAFSLSSSEGFDDPPAYLSSHLSGSFSRHRPVNSNGPLRQTTLFGERLPASSVPVRDENRRVTGENRLEEPPTHHKLNRDALGTWVYPTNLGTIRDYQYNIVQKGLFHNLLVALPTGLGKTFIAATIMLNWFRWTTNAQVVFVAPTKPLVAQQIEACFGIAGIPRSQTSMLTGATPPGLRAEEWSTKRVYFLTPQTMINDLKTGICDPKRIVCVVVDEAHRATGGYAYVEVVQFIRRFNPSFRVLALTATPGSSVEAVQEVLDGLNISRVEIRTEESLDIRQYVHSRKVDTVLFDPTEDITKMRDLFSKVLQPILDQLNQANAYWIRDPMSLTAYGLTQAKRQWMNSDAGRNANQGFKGKMFAIFALLASLAHSITLLNYHGIGPFYHYLVGFRGEVESGQNSGMYRKQINESPHFQDMMDQARRWVSDSDFVGHPKLAYLRQVVLNHFLDAGAGHTTTEGIPPSATRIMIFVQYRDSADEIARVLKRNEPMIRPHVFVGQSTGRNSTGMNQKTQLEVIQKFQKGVYNTLVATCVGEEGLDIGEVDLIICCDSSSSPIRMLQRMGRTGRKRAGNIVLLLMRGKEEESFVKAKDAYESMQRMIAAGTRFTFHDDLSSRILPRDVNPVVEKKIVDIPLENTQGDLPEPRKRGKIPKRPPKKFHMPDGVRTGFVRASRLRDGDPGESSTDEADTARNLEISEDQLIEIPGVDAVVLKPAEEKELNRRYQYVYGEDEAQTVSLPKLNAHPAAQRSLRGTKHMPHSRVSKRMVKMLQAIHNVGDDEIHELQRRLHPEDRKMILSNPQPTSLTLELEPSAAEPRGRSRRDRSSHRSARSPLASARYRSWSSSEADPAFAEREDLDDDLDNFIVPDGAGETTASSSPTLLSSANSATKPFYTSPKKTLPQSSNPEEDFPDVSALVAKVGNKRTKAGAKESRKVRGKEVGPRKRRRVQANVDADEWD